MTAQHIWSSLGNFSQIPSELAARIAQAFTATGGRNSPTWTCVHVVYGCFVRAVIVVGIVVGLRLVGVLSTCAFFALSM